MSHIQGGRFLPARLWVHHSGYRPTVERTQISKRRVSSSVTSVLHTVTGGKYVCQDFDSGAKTSKVSFVQVDDGPVTRSLDCLFGESGNRSACLSALCSWSLDHTGGGGNPTNQPANQPMRYPTVHGSRRPRLPACMGRCLPSAGLFDVRRCGIRGLSHRHELMSCFGLTVCASVPAPQTVNVADRVPSTALHVLSHRTHRCREVRAGQDVGELLLRERGGHGPSGHVRVHGEAYSVQAHRIPSRCAQQNRTPLGVAA